MSADFSESEFALRQNLRQNLDGSVEITFVGYGIEASPGSKCLDSVVVVSLPREGSFQSNYFMSTSQEAVLAVLHPKDHPSPPRSPLSLTLSILKSVGLQLTSRNRSLLITGQQYQASLPLLLKYSMSFV
ncbi:hypothetical protein V3C99_016951 [Haemonchus contortus]